MPYIATVSREAIDPHIQSLSDNIHSVGDLNYVVTRLSLKLIQSWGLHYDQIAGVVGTLNLVAAEMVRRLIGEFEDHKIEQNGDVPEYAEMLLKLHTDRKHNYDHASDAAQSPG